uniref:Uncharacterized protein n=1 Tax=Chromera velia CCMP2878 TaxID=1169474 RepID=A0A0G4HSG0_9ALVE|eukprot:Cvel_8258.t1-p1 / transcript=Cvel_8258.t1 / gene=Cvel_8258 / organism=Chromera_velia_CCMP2878 / gene_product=hypothetical protein / transcript_product=hypothetical protein / location=Cvel_scaffold452:33730-36684(+) / protein_length=584 / sequence_SO=supercontig / SO=protein_coding / is_pseudo=false
MFTKAGTVARLFLLYLLSTCGLVGSSPDGDLPVYCAKDVAASRRVPPLVFRDELNPVLAQVQVFHRHGARTPASPHPCWAGFEEANWSCSLHEKVHVGMDFSPPSPSDQPTNGEVSTQPPDPSAALTPSPVPKAALVVSKIFDGLGPNPSDFVGDCMVGQLLAEGEDQMREIGRHLRDAYVLEVENPEGEPAFFSANLSESGFNLPLGRFKKPPLHLFSSIEIDLYRQDPAWSQNAVFWRSDDVPRVYASGAAMLAELLSLPPAKPGAPEPPGGLPWERRRTTQSLRGVGGGRGSEEDRKKSERGGRTLHDSLFLPPDGGEVIQIPVHIGHINEDWLRGGDQHCDVEGLRLEALNSSAYREFYSDKENVQLRAALSEVLQTDVGEIPFDFEDCLMTFACTDKRPTLPSGLEVGGPLFQSSVEYIDQMWQIQAKHANHRANSLRMYPLVAEMSDLLHQAQYQYSIDPFQLIGRRREEEEGSPRRSLHQVGRYFPDNSPPLVVFSGHDTTIGPLLDVLGLWDGKWPPYASLLLLEMYFTTEGRKFRLIYNGEVVTHRFKGCKDDQSEHLCDVSLSPFLSRERRRVE